MEKNKVDIRVSALARDASKERLSSLILPPEDLAKPIVWSELFAREGLVEVEIGVGKGKFLRDRALAFPERNFLGIEKSLKWLEHAALRMEKSGVENIRLLSCYAEELIENYFPAGSIDAYHILFSDPWPKKRHHKRRLFQGPFLLEVVRTLRIGGRVNVATDHAKYFDVIQDLFMEFHGTNLEVNVNAQPLDFASNFQVKYQREGRPIFFLEAKKIK